MLTSSAEIEYFLEVCNTLNLSRASERLGISQPSLSLAMKRLEASVGTAVFIRHKTGVTLTPAGKQLFLHARKLLQVWEKTKSSALASQHEVQGHFKLGCHSTMVIYLVSTFLSELLEQYLKLDIHLTLDLSKKITEQVINLSLDIGIVANPVKHPDLIIRKLCDDEVTFWVGPGHRKIQNIKSEHAVILCDPELRQTQTLLQKIKKAGFSSNRIITMNSLEVVASLTSKGCGIGILPENVAKSLYPKQLKKLPKCPVYYDEVCLIYRHENRDIEAIQTIVNHIKKSVIK